MGRPKDPIPEGERSSRSPDATIERKCSNCGDTICIPDDLSDGGHLTKQCSAPGQVYCVVL